LKFFSALAVSAVLAILIFLAFNFLNLKIIYQSALTGKDNLEYAVDLIKERKYQSAADLAEKAEANFQFCAVKIDVYYRNYFFSRIPFFNNRINDFVYLVSSAEILSRVVKEGAQFGAGFDDIINDRGATYASLSKNEKKQVLKKLYESAPELNGIKADIELALLNLNNVDLSGILWSLKNKIATLNDQLFSLKYIFDRAIPISQTLPVLLGYPEQASYLVLLQNRDELRPTGGFIGTYGILEIKDSDITRLETHDIYHMDMPVKDRFNIKPPDPLFKYLGVDKWYMRDANWSPDWPTAAAKIEWFYEQEDKLLPPKNQINKFNGEFDGLIGINIQLITDLLAVTGPIIVENIEYNKDNFGNLLEYRVEKGHEELGIPSWQRKEVIGDIVKILKQKITEMPLANFFEVVKIADRNLLEKNIIIYFKNPAIQEIIQEQNWAGEIKDLKDDFIMIVDANMASLKTDSVMNRKIDYKLSQDINGLFADLRVTYAHGGGIDWRTTRYRDYVRFYVPLGSTLIKADGFAESAALATEEAGKTVFSGFTIIEPGKFNTLHLYYKLPAGLDMKAKSGAYGLYLQKQPGSNVESVHVKLEFLNNIQSYEPTGFYINKFNNSLSWETDLDSDRQLNLILD
jgi:hypothetical protein